MEMIGDALATRKPKDSMTSPRIVLRPAVGKSTLANPNAHTYVNGTDVETHRDAVA